MTYSYTQISQYLSCPRRYKHRYLMAGRRKTPGRPCCSAGHLSRLWLPTSSDRMLPPCSTGSGQLVGTAVSTTPSGIAGIACCSRACSCSIALPRTIGFASASPGATCRSSSARP